MKKLGTAAEKKLLKRKKILDSAYQLFMTNSVTSTAVDDVVKMAGVAKGTFYLYFRDKHDLLEQIITYKSADLLKEAVSSVEKHHPDASLKDKALALCEYIIDYMCTHHEFTALIDNNITCCFNIFSSGLYSEYNELLTKFIKAFTDDGYDEKQAKMIIYMVTELIGSICCDSVMGTGPYKIEEIRNLLIKSITHILEVKENG